MHFALVSAGGVLLIQTSVYAMSIMSLRHFINSSFIVINLSNLIASFVVMFWNYHGYRLLVFNTNGDSNENFRDGRTTASTTKIEAEETA